MWSRTTLTDPSSEEVVAPTLIIGRDAWNMLQAYVNGVQTEINGFGYITRQPGNVFYWATGEDVFITSQTVTMGSADNTATDVAKAEYRAIMDGRRDDLRLQWHSHVKGRAYHSATDMKTIESFGTAGMEWFVSLVTNMHGDVTARLDVYQPLRIGAPMRVILVDTVDQVMHDRATAEIAELVTVTPPPKKRRALRVGGTQVVVKD